MDQVRRGVIAPRRVALLDIDFGGDGIADFDRTFFDLHFVNN